MVLEGFDGDVITYSAEDIARLMGKEWVEETKRIAKETEHLWCRCDEPDYENMTFHDNGECDQCDKHHYHCGRCGKIYQVG